MIKANIRRRIVLLSALLLSVMLPLSAFAAAAPKTAPAVKITKHKLATAVMLDKVKLLDFSGQYPDVGSAKKPLLKKIDETYANDAISYLKSATGELTASAFADYQGSLTGEYPFRMYGAGMDTTATLNANNILSTYTDQYIYTGGAHGSTVRSSYTWNLATGNQVLLKDLMKNNPDYKTTVINKILQKADEQQKNDPVYFDNYRESISKYFNPDSFYLTPQNIVFYYQQYDIAPYAYGFASFEFPYSVLGITLDYKTLP